MHLRDPAYSAALSTGSPSAPGKPAWGYDRRVEVRSRTSLVIVLMGVALFVAAGCASKKFAYAPIGGGPTDEDQLERDFEYCYARAYRGARPHERYPPHVTWSRAKSMSTRWNLGRCMTEHGWELAEKEP